jgi:hypothetical protein
MGLTDALGPITEGIGTAVLQRTFLLQKNTSTGIPIPLAVLDAVMEEVPEYSADVTQHPVEAGPEVSDHIQLKNPTLRLTGTISNTPLDLSVSIGNLLSGGIAAITSSQARSNLLNTGLSQAAGIVGAKLMGSSANPLAAGLAGAADAMARTILLNAYEARNPFDVVTKRQTYKNMVIEKLSYPRDNKTGFQLIFQIDLVQVRIVSPFSVQINTVSESVATSATGKTDMGNQATKQVSDQTSSAVNGSWLRSIVKGA